MTLEIVIKLAVATYVSSVQLLSQLVASLLTSLHLTSGIVVGRRNVIQRAMEHSQIAAPTNPRSRTQLQAPMICEEKAGPATAAAAVKATKPSSLALVFSGPFSSSPPSPSAESGLGGRVAFGEETPSTSVLSVVEPPLNLGEEEEGWDTGRDA